MYEEKMFTIEIEDSLVSYIQHETNQNVEYVEHTGIWILVSNLFLKGVTGYVR